MAKGWVNLVFVVGASRSGTTMLCRILGRNEQLFGLQELHYFGDIWDPYGENYLVPPAEIIEIAATLLARQRKDIWGGTPESADYAAAKKIFPDGEPVTYSHLFQNLATGLAAVDNAASSSPRKASSVRAD